jgi:DNA uptake protein ComE-like DNA-binding protein
MKQSPLYFTRAERRLLLAFSFVSLIITSISFPFKKHYSISRISLEGDGTEIKMIPDQEDKTGDSAEIRILSCDSVDQIPISQISAENWMELGASKQLAQRIQRYREKGGRIERAEDLLRIYDIDSTWVTTISPCIVWQTGSLPASPRTRAYQRTENKPTILDLNLADSAALVKLPGIGPVLSTRIVRFRDQLGGFYDLAQLSETYGLPDSTYQRLLPRLKIETACKKLKINRMTAKEIVKHPYFSWKEAITIERYRESHGPFKEADHFFSVKALDSSRIVRWLPYLDLSTDP